MRVRDSLPAIAVVVLLLVPFRATQADVRHYQVNESSFITWVEDDPWQPEEFEPATFLPAPFVDEGPSIDGQSGDPAWSGAKSVTVPLHRGAVQEVTLQAVYTEDEVFLLVSWPDATRDDRHHPWIWNQELGRYVEDPQVEDSLLVSLESGCEWSPSLLAGYVYDFDGWRWLAARSDPLGQAVDVNGHAQDRWIANKGYVQYQSTNKEPFWNLKFLDHEPGIMTTPWLELDRAYQLKPIDEVIYVSMEPDGYRPPPFVARVPPPAIPDGRAGGDVTPAALETGTAIAVARPIDVAPQFKPVKLTGDAGEVTAKGRWADGRWTVEFRRVLETPARTKTDSILDRLTQFSIHVFDHTERVDEASESGRLFLQFEPAEAASPRRGQ